MQSLNILVTQRNIRYISPDSSEPVVFERSFDYKGLFSTLSNSSLKEESLSGTKINFILDQDYLKYEYFKFPPINLKKISNILEFELEDTLLNGVENYVYDFSYRKNKNTLHSDVGVYTITKRNYNDLLQFCKENNAELRWILSINNLIDLDFNDKQDPGSHILLQFDEFESIARLFVYEGGFLVDSSATKVINTSNESGISQAFIRQINQKIKAVQLKKENIPNIKIQNAPDGILINQDQLIELNSQDSQKSAPVLISYDQLFIPSLLNHRKKINLVKSHFLFLNELKKHLRAFTLSAVILLSCLALFIGSIIYNGKNKSGYFQTLNIRYNQTIEKYLPKGTSKSNALSILKEKVKKLREENNSNLKFSKRTYKISITLTDLSLLKRDVITLDLKRFSQNEQSIRFSGNVSSVNEFDLLKQKLEKLFPKKFHRMIYNEKSRGNKSVEFSVSIQFINP